MLRGLNPGLDRSVIDAMVRDGPAVDGISLRREPTIDGLGMDAHQEVLDSISLGYLSLRSG